MTVQSVPPTRCSPCGHVSDKFFHTTTSTITAKMTNTTMIGSMISRRGDLRLGFLGPNHGNIAFFAYPYVPAPTLDEECPAVSGPGRAPSWHPRTLGR